MLRAALSAAPSLSPGPRALPPDTQTETPGPALSERALVRTLRALREIVEEEHALEVDRAAGVTPLAYAGVTPVPGSGGRAYAFRADGAHERTPAWASALKAGDSVEVVAPDARAGSGVFGSVVAATAGGLTVDLGRPTEPQRLPPHGLVRLRVDDNQRTLRLQAIERLVRERESLPWVGVALAQGGPLAPADRGWEPGADCSLTEAQQRAVAGATRARDLFLIQGPPGTGKTTVIATLVKDFVEERGARVLLTSKGHRAIDNALERVGAADLHTLRLGQSAKVTGAGQEALLAAVLARAEEDAPGRYQAERAATEAALRALTTAEQTLGQLAGVDRGLAEAESAVEAREAEIDRAFEEGLSLLQADAEQVADDLAAARAAQPRSDEEETAPGLLTRLRDVAHVPARWLRARRERAPLLALERRAARHQAAEEWLHQRRRFYLVRKDLAALRRHVARLREDRYRLALAAQAALHAGGLGAQTAGADDPAHTLEALAAVRRERQRLEAVLAATRPWAAVLERPGALADLLVEAADVVAATAVGVNSGRDGARTAGLEYDVAIVDEAGQAQAADLVVALSRARKVVLVGDHKQLAPYVDDDLLRRCREKKLDTTWLEKSLFELLWERLPATHRTRLNLQFRMPAPLADFLGRAFYEGDYGSAEAKLACAPVSDLFRAPLVFVDTADERDRRETALSPGFLNQAEARLVAEVAARLPERYRSGEGLGVIAPYGAQVDALRRALAAALGREPREPWLVDNVATVDSFQGQERNVVLVSLTRSNAEGLVGFLSDLNRLNVTLSRARQQLVVIGDLGTLAAQGGGPERRAFAQLMRDFAWHAGKHGERLTAAELRERLADG